MSGRTASSRPRSRVLSVRHAILGPMSAPSALDAPVTLVIGPETLLAERAISAVTRAARATDPDADVAEVAGADLTAGALAEHVSPSLFATCRVLVVRGVQDVSDTAAEALLALAASPPDDVRVILVHPGGPKGKRLLEAVGGDLRGLASAAAQLVADAEHGLVDDAVVGTYFEGRAEVKGWAVADRAVEGRTVVALEQLRWALETGTDPVLVTAALATAVRSLARLSGAPRGVRDADLAPDLGVPPWKLRILRSQLRGWTPSGLVRAIRAVAAADLQVKGGGNDPTLALTTAVVEIGAARAA